MYRILRHCCVVLTRPSKRRSRRRSADCVAAAASCARRCSTRATRRKRSKNSAVRANCLAADSNRIALCSVCDVCFKLAVGRFHHTSYGSDLMQTKPRQCASVVSSRALPSTSLSCRCITIVPRIRISTSIATSLRRLTRNRRPKCSTSSRSKPVPKRMSLLLANVVLASFVFSFAFGFILLWFALLDIVLMSGFRVLLLQACTSWISMTCSSTLRCRCLRCRLTICLSRRSASCPSPTHS